LGFQDGDWVIASIMNQPLPIVYLDSSALGRFFDDQSQPRIRLETEGVHVILEYVQSGVLSMARSPVLLDEIRANPNYHARTALTQLLDEYGIELPLRQSRIQERAEFLRSKGITFLDAMHVAIAEDMNASFVTCDDRLIRA